MHRFNSDGVSIAYLVEGEGPPVLLIHGFASNARVNWVDTGWVKSLVRAGFTVIAHDNRGHGESEKLYDPALYPATLMAEDARRLLDHLGHERASVIGYSMGARIAAFLAIHHPGRIDRAVFAGLAARMITGVGGAEAIAQSLEARDGGAAADPGVRSFRTFAEQTRSDLRALAACIRASRQRISVEELATIAVPVLVVAGEKDDIAGEVGSLVAAIPDATGLTLPGRNHMNAVGDRAFKEGAIAFLRAAGGSLSDR